MRVLVVKNDGIGDLIITSGIIRELTKQYATVDLVTCIENKPIAEYIDGLNQIFYVSRNSLGYHSLALQFGFAVKKRLNANDKQTIALLQKVEYDVVIILRRFITQSTFVIANMLNAKEKLYMWEYPTNIPYKIAKKFTQNAKLLERNKNLISEQEFYAEHIKTLFPETLFDFTPSLNLEDERVSQTRANDVLGIVISGNAVSINAELWIDLIEKLNYRNIILFGGTKEVPIAQKILNRIKDRNIENMVAKVSFKDSISFIEKCCVIVANDTGFTHFASLYHNNIIVLLGGGTFKRFFPWSFGRKQKIIYYGMECFDCQWRCYQPTEKECIKNLFNSNLKEAIVTLINSSEIEEINLSSQKGYFSLLDRDFKIFSNGSTKDIKKPNLDKIEFILVFRKFRKMFFGYIVKLLPVKLKRVIKKMING